MIRTSSVVSFLRRIPGVRSCVTFYRAVRFLVVQPAATGMLLASRSSARPVLLFYCHQAAHRQIIQEILLALVDRHRDRFTIIVLNHFRPKAASEDTRTPAGVHEVNEVPMNVLPAFGAAVLFTPHVGMRPHVIPRGATVVHLLVSLTSLDGVYGESHFDDYDYILCAGEHQIDSFQQWRKKRPQLAGKILMRGGYPKLDLALKSSASNGTDDGNTVVYAPTHVYPVNEALASLRQHGTQIVAALLAAGHRVIFRPHPVSFSDEDAALVARIVATHENDPRFSLDRSESYLASYSAASLMVTDLSGTGFTFAFTFGRPAIFYCENARGEEGMQGIQFECREKIGGVARSIADLTTLTKRLLEHSAEARSDIAAFRDQTIFHLGQSGRYVAERIDHILARSTCDDWTTL